MTCAAIALGLTSCNVTRTITTQSQYYQRGDTTCTIVTKTIEQYDISRKRKNLSRTTPRGNFKNGKKTMLAWYWKICGAEYDQQHNG